MFAGSKVVHMHDCALCLLVCRTRSDLLEAMSELGACQDVKIVILHFLAVHVCACACECEGMCLGDCISVVFVSTARF